MARHGARDRHDGPLSGSRTSTSSNTSPPAARSARRSLSWCAVSVATHRSRPVTPRPPAPTPHRSSRSSSLGRGEDDLVVSVTSGIWVQRPSSPSRARTLPSSAAPAPVMSLTARCHDRANLPAQRAKQPTLGARGHTSGGWGCREQVTHLDGESATSQWWAPPEGRDLGVELEDRPPDQGHPRRTHESLTGSA